MALLCQSAWIVTDPGRSRFLQVLGATIKRPGCRRAGSRLPAGRKMGRAVPHRHECDLWLLPLRLQLQHGADDPILQPGGQGQIRRIIA